MKFASGHYRNSIKTIIHNVNDSPTFCNKKGNEVCTMEQ